MTSHLSGNLGSSGETRQLKRDPWRVQPPPSKHCRRDASVAPTGHHHCCHFAHGNVLNQSPMFCFVSSFFNVMVIAECLQLAWQKRAAQPHCATLKKLSS